MSKKKRKIPELTPEQIAGWEDYRNSLYLQKSKSDDLYEKAITFISSGALGITLTFHDKIVPYEKVEYVIFVSIGWGLLVATLFINLISNYQTSRSVDNTIDSIDEFITYKINYEDFKEGINNKNKYINNLNKASIILLGLGLLSIILYVSLNIHYGKKEQSEFNTETVNGQTFEKGKFSKQRSDSTKTYITTE